MKYTGKCSSVIVALDSVMQFRFFSSSQQRAQQCPSQPGGPVMHFCPSGNRSYVTCNYCSSTDTSMC